MGGARLGRRWRGFLGSTGTAQENQGAQDATEGDHGGSVSRVSAARIRLSNRDRSDYRPALKGAREVARRAQWKVIMKRRLLSSSLSALGIFTAVTVAAPVRAQQRDGFTLDQFQPAPAGDRFFGVQGGGPEGRALPRLMVLGDYAYKPLVLYQNGGDKSLGTVVSDRFIVHVGAGVSFWKRLNLSIDLPLLLASEGTTRTTAGTGTFAAPTGASVGDLRLDARVRLVTAGTSAFSVNVAGSVWLPSGDQAKLAGDGKVRGMPALVVNGEIGAFVYAANLGILVRPSATYGATVIDDQLAFGAAAGVLLAERKLLLGPELYGTTAVAGKDTFGRGNTNLEALLGAHLRIGPMVLGAGAGPGITKGIGTPAARVVASVAFAPEEKKAPPAPKDRDRDGIIDADDACPDEKGKPSDDSSVNGCPDRDDDGIRDPKDACVDVPGEANKDPKLNGCPPDRDGDGILDEEDACPDVKGVKNEDPKLNGCPPDRDGDGVLDDDDACPDLKGIKSEDPEKNGCPGDRDGDDIRDDKDACPDEKGKPDPDPKKNGCPTLVRVTKTEIHILQQVQFKTGSDEILAASADLLTQVANVLSEHSEILKIEVQGHTDNRAGAAYNKKLSQRRAASVVKWLTSKGGISEDRLVPQGYGLEKPIADNATDEGRQKNRRVEFKIIEKKSTETTSEETP